MSLLLRLTIQFWPLWGWLIALHVVADLLSKSSYDQAGKVAASVVYAWTVYGSAPEPRLKLPRVMLAGIMSLVMGVYGFEIAFRPIDHFSDDHGFSLLSALAAIDYPLSLAAALACLTPLGFLLVGNPELVARLQGFQGGVRQGRSTAHGSARWMSAAEKSEIFPASEAFPGQQLIVGEDYDPRKEPQKLGKAPLLHYGIEGKGHVISVAPSGSGKSRGLVIPNILHWSRGLVVLDCKGDLAPKFNATRGRMGHSTAVLDPDSETYSDAINVLDWLDTSKSSIIGEAKTVASWLAGDDPKESTNPAFRGNAKDLIWVGILEIMFNDTIPAEDKHVGMLRDFLTNPFLIGILQRIADEPEESFAFGKAQGIANGLLAVAKATDTWAGVLFDANAMTSWLSQPRLSDVVSGVPFGGGRTIKLSNLTDGRTDIFVSLSVDILDSSPEIARLIFGSFFSVILRHGKFNPNSDSRVLFLLDEMPRIGYMKIIETARDAGRPFIILWAFVQDLGQLRRIYGDHAVQSWIANAQVRTFMAVSDPDTARYVSDFISTATIETLQKTDTGGRSSNAGQVGGGHSSGQSTSIHVVGRPLQTVGEVMDFPQFPDGGTYEQYLMIRGKPPLRCGLALWDLHDVVQRKWYQPEGSHDE